VNFRPELAAAVMAGEKTVTRRLVNRGNPRSHWWVGGCFYKVGRDYAVCPGRGEPAIGRVRIVSVRLEKLGHLLPEEAWKEGFEFAYRFNHAWARINGGYDPDALVWRVEFKVEEEA